MTIDRRLFLASSAAAASLSLTGIRRANAVPVAVVAAAWVGQKLLEGALHYEGGQIMSRALGDPVLSDVRSWIAAAVAEIKAFIQAALTQVVINDMQAELDAVNTAIYEYASLKPQNQKENRFLLETCDTATAELVPLSMAYDQIYIVTAAMGFRLFTLLALYQLDQDKGHITSAKAIMDYFVSKSVRLRDSISARMDPSQHLRSQNCSFAAASTAPQPSDILVMPPPTFCMLFDDGQLVSLGSGSDQPQQAEYNRRKQAYLKLKSDFLSVTGNSINAAIQCYQGMCKKTGGTYTPPVTPANVTPLPSVNGSIVMPGARLRI